MKHPYLYHNRDLSWLSFNYRVLQEARDLSLPLYERIKFLAIYSSNLDEFYKVRVASYRTLLEIPLENRQKLKVNPDKILRQIHREVERQQEEFGAILRNIIVPELNEHHIYIPNHLEFDEEIQNYVTEYFEMEVLPYLQPVLLVKGKILPFLRDNAIYLAIILRRKSNKPQEVKKRRKHKYALVMVPSGVLPRFKQFTTTDGRFVIPFLEDIIKFKLDLLFPGYDITDSYSIKLSRDADLHIQNEFSGDLVSKIEKSLIRRKTGLPSRFLYDSRIPGKFLKLLKEAFFLNKDDLVKGSVYHNISDFFNFPNPLAPQLERDKEFPLHLEALDQATSLFQAFRKKDYLLHFPYQSYDYFIRFLNSCAFDPKVEAIKMTQYRVASNSAVVNALISAARNGKNVTVFVEVKARFDEEANIKSALEMKKAGIKIIYSIPGLKVHAKVALVLRRSKEDLRGYAFLSTGNFNEKTARTYSDHGLFTTRTDFIQELIMLFEHLENRHNNCTFKHLLVGQFGMKERFLKMIDQEISQAKAGKKAHMILKMNGLEDPVMTDKLYQASLAGVSIDLIVRGICVLVPQQSFSKNIRVLRIVDKYLEHARIFYFYNGGAETVYLSSADWMKRNLNRRIEVAFPLIDPLNKQEIIDLLNIQLQDTVKGRLLDQDLNNTPFPESESPAIRAQIGIYQYLEEKTKKTPTPS